MKFSKELSYDFINVDIFLSLSQIPQLLKHITSPFF